MMTKKHLENLIKKLETEKDEIYNYHLKLEYPNLYTEPYDNEKVSKWVAENQEQMTKKVDAISKAIYGLKELEGVW